MMIEKDERTIVVENESYRIAYSVISYGILIDIMYRSFFLKEAPWDLFVLIFLGGIVATAYQYKQKIFTHKWIRSILILVVLSALTALIVALII